MSNAILDDILLFHSRLHDRDAGYDIRADGIIETPVGCFRVAIDEPGNAAALFFARHADDLAACDGEQGDHSIGHKDRVSLIAMRQIRTDTNARWDNSNDGRRQLDLSWVRFEIAQIIHHLPRCQMREAALHRIGPDTHVSAFVGYRTFPSSEVRGEFSGDIYTKTRGNCTALQPPLRDEGRSQLHRLFLRAHDEIVRRRLSAVTSLRSLDAQTGAEHTHFKKQTTRSVQLSDFSIRLGLIWDGYSPISWTESRLMPIYRGLANGSDLLRDRLREFKEQGWEHTIRRVLPYALHWLADGPVSLLIGSLIDNASEFGMKEKLKNIPPAFKKIVDWQARRFSAIDSNLHTHLIRPDPNEFKGLCWVDPGLYGISFLNDIPKNYPTPERVFRRWVQSLYYAPYAAMFEYRGKNDQVLSPDRLGECRYVSAQISNGMMLYFMPQEGALYAYFNRDEYQPGERRLPRDAGHFLKAGQVLKLNMRDWHAQSEVVAFERFKSELRRIAEVDCVDVPNAGAPGAEIINSKPAAPLLPDFLPSFLQHPIYK